VRRVKNKADVTFDFIKPSNEQSTTTRNCTEKNEPKITQNFVMNIRFVLLAWLN